jgi:hypothetical protein
MAKPTADKKSPLAHGASRAAGVLSVTHMRYLTKVRKLLVAYQRAGGVKQQQIFVTMMHAFMQELCDYPPTSYTVTTAAYSHPEAGSYPHVVPTSYAANLTLLYFTASEDPDDVQDLWGKHAQVYLATYEKGDVAAESATHVVFTNFFLIDGASKDPNTGAWAPWSVSDLEASQGTRIDLRILDDATALAPTSSHGVHKRLQTLQYQIHPIDEHAIPAGLRRSRS